jgi:hypothetical protein
MADDQTITRGRTLSSQLAERTGLEPATPGVTGRYSNQLNYRSIPSGLRTESRVENYNASLLSPKSLVLSP